MVHVRQHMVLLSPRSVCVSACARACARACVRAYVCVKLGIVFPAGAFAFVGSEACEHLAIFAQEGPGCSTHHPSKAVCFSEGEVYTWIQMKTWPLFLTSVKSVT